MTGAPGGNGDLKAGESPRRSLLVIKGSFEDAMGGSVVAALNRGRSAARAGWDVTVATTTDGCESLDLLRRSGLGARLFPRRFPRALAASPGLLWWLLTRARDYDLVEVHEIFAFPTFYARLACGLRGVPFVIHPNNSLDPYDLRKHAPVKRRLRPVLRWLLNGARGIWTASQLEADRLETFGAAVPLSVSPLPVELSTHLAGPAAPAADQAYVLFLGRLDRKKGIERLIRAVAVAQESVEGLRLVVAGTGEDDYLRSLQALAESALAPGTYAFPGHVAREEREALFRGAALFVLHSDNENFGIAVVEALGYGLPVVLSPEVYIAGDLESRGVATVVPLNEVDALAKSIAELSQVKANRRGELGKAARLVAADYDMPACVARDAAIRDRLVTGPRRSG